MTPPQKRKGKGANQGKYAFGSSIEKSKMLKLPAIHSQAKMASTPLGHMRSGKKYK